MLQAVRLIPETKKQPAIWIAVRSGSSERTQDNSFMTEAGEESLEHENASHERNC